MASSTWDMLRRQFRRRAELWIGLIIGTLVGNFFIGLALAIMAGTAWVIERIPQGEGILRLAFLAIQVAGTLVTGLLGMGILIAELIVGTQKTVVVARAQLREEGDVR